MIKDRETGEINATVLPNAAQRFADDSDAYSAFSFTVREYVEGGARASKSARGRPAWGAGEGLGSGEPPGAPRSGIETPLRAAGARRRVPIRRYLFVNGGASPPFTLSPENVGSEQSSLP